MQRVFRRTLHLKLPHWRNLRSWHRAPATNTKRLLTTGDSLTKLCQDACAGKFSVLPLHQAWSRPSLDEARLLGIAPQQLAFVRQVLLRCDSEAWIYARTVVPLASLRGKHRRILHLGNRSLGAFLFSFRKLQRIRHQCSRISAGALSAFTGGALSENPPIPVWGRRQVYRAQGRDLLITELFLLPERLRSVDLSE